MLNKKEKLLVDREIVLYKKEQILAADEDICSRIHTNWEAVDKARHDNYKNQLKISIETAKIEARLVAMKEIDVKRNEEITWLRNCVSNALKPAPKE